MRLLIKHCVLLLHMRTALKYILLATFLASSPLFAESQMPKKLMPTTAKPTTRPQRTGGQTAPAPDSEEAKRFSELKTKAAAGDIDAMIQYGHLLMYPGGYRQFIPQNKPQGIALLDAATAKGSRRACDLLANEYRSRSFPDPRTGETSSDNVAEMVKYSVLEGGNTLEVNRGYVRFSEETEAEGRRRAAQWAAKNGQTVPITPIAER